jgi:hypothetical protein
MNLQWNLETYILLGGTIFSGIGTIWIMKTNWKQYGLLFLISSVIGNILCFLFILLKFYTYPYNLFPSLFPMPFSLLLSMFPFYVLFGVKYSPSSWKFKIPFYWVLVHTGVLGETLAQNHTQVIRYGKYWDTWDSYTWWWIFLLVFELIGGIVVSKENRRPILEESFRYGNSTWYLVHFILIATIFLAGFYLGTKF